MGIFIHLQVSKSVTEEEWEKVYEETLALVKAFPLAERRRVPCRGIETICLVPTIERVDSYGWNNEKTRIGWMADGDYETMHIAEAYYLPKNLINRDSVEAEEETGDALMAVLPAYLDYDWDDIRCSHCYELWGNKTQGEPYHMYLLSIACLIEDRLGDKAFVYGDITRGQCRKAVEMANEYLDMPIDIPDRCDMGRFAKRVEKLPLNESERLAVFENLYLGTLNGEFGEYIRRNYTEGACDEYWKKRFDDYRIGTVGFDGVIHEYLLLGFDLEKLCHLTDYIDSDGNHQYEKFVLCIMDAKLHVMDKNCEDALEIDQEEAHPYGIFTLLAQFAFIGAKNKKVDRYIPIEEIRYALNRGLAGKCNVNAVIDEYLAKEAAQSTIRMAETDMGDDERRSACEQDPAEAFNQILGIKKEALQRESEEYDICDPDYEDLIYYEKGDTVHPMMKKNLGRSYNFHQEILKEKEYARLMKKTADCRCRWLVAQNRSILIRDKDWEKNFADIEEHTESFARYYPMVRVVAERKAIINILKAMTLNDDLYAYCRELADIYRKEQEDE